MCSKQFFDESREQSRIKSEIVSKYFWAWAKVMVAVAKKRGENRIAYIDLFAGPGRFRDEYKSTPLQVLWMAVQEPDLCRMLVTLFIYFSNIVEIRMLLDKILKTLVAINICGGTRQV